jgi:hypothetical protein
MKLLGKNPRFFYKSCRNNENGQNDAAEWGLYGMARREDDMIGQS